MCCIGRHLLKLGCICEFKKNENWFIGNDMVYFKLKDIVQLGLNIAIKVIRNESVARRLYMGLIAETKFDQDREGVIELS